MLQLGEVELYLAKPEDATDPALVERYFAICDEKERERYRRFYFDGDRHVFLVAHALMRTALSRALGDAPESFRFSEGEHGRPELAPDAGRLKFNLSHTAGMVGCAFSRDGQLGLDVERVDPQRAGLEVARRFFSASEAWALEQLESGREERFFDLWTLKEAFIKAKGAGLTLPLCDFGFEIAEQAVRVSFADTLQEDARAWSFALYAFATALGPSHRVAVGLDRPGMRVRIFEGIPLVRWEESARRPLASTFV